jgi:hypothetical protein
MKTQKKLIVVFSVILAAAIMALGLSSCPEEGEKRVFAGANLLSIQIGDKSSPIPKRIKGSDWDNINISLYEEDSRTIAFAYDTDIKNVRIRVSVSAGARAYYAISNRTTRPVEWEATGVPASFDTDQFVYIKVVSEDNATFNYYRFFARVSSPVRELTGLSIAGRDADMADAVPGNTWDDENILPGSVYITNAESAGSIVAGYPWSDSATVRFAITKNLTTEPVFSNNSVFQAADPTASITANWKESHAFSDTDWLWAKVTAENGIDSYYYRFFVFTGRMATIAELNFIAGEKQYEAVGKGSPHQVWARVGAGGFESPHQPNSGWVINMTLDDPAGSWQYAKIASTSAAVPTVWQTPTASGSAPLQFDNNECLVILVTPINPTQVNSTRKYYKVKIVNQAAEFVQHPKPAVYYVGEAGTDTAAAPLTFELDRGQGESGWTYQWYEANSWYGGYGFDADGNVLGEDGEIAPGFSEFNELTYYNNEKFYIKGFDEKKNITLHNGGNQYYRLPVPGRPIEGATNATYTPPITHTPFLGGYSNETHYYWVVVTSPTGLTATSKRAVIVTEWGVVYKWGVPAYKVDENGNTTSELDKVTKKHHIVNLQEDLARPARNEKPFTYKRERYEIKLTLPADFDIMDYSVCTAQALFFLADGTPWIQNWTQGDLYFYVYDPVEKDDKVQQVGFYNLTNNNGTLGLAGDSKEPQGGDLVDNPTYVVIAPAGEKPPKQMPPLDANGWPVNINDAQGWFCQFIELVELRFEGPSRK